MGVAIVITDEIFDSENLGQITISKDIPVKGITISLGEKKGNKIPINVSYVPTNTNNKGVKFELSGDGKSFAEINQDSNNYELIIHEGADNASISIKAVSTSNSLVESNVLQTVIKYEEDLSSTPLYVSKVGQFELPQNLGSPENTKWTLCVNAKCLNTYNLSGLDAVYYQDTSTRSIGFGFANPSREGERNIIAASGVVSITFEELIELVGGYSAFKNGEDSGLMAIRRNGQTLAISSDGKSWENKDYTWTGYGNKVKIGTTNSSGNVNCDIYFDFRIDNDSEVLEFFNSHKVE